MIKLHTGNKNKTIPFVTSNLSGHSTKDRQKKQYYYWPSHTQLIS